MEVTKDISVFFLYAMGMGTYLFHYLVSTQLTGVGFFKLVLSITFGSILLGGILDYTMNGTQYLPYLCLNLGLLVVMYLKHGDVRTNSMKFLSVLTLAGMFFHTTMQFKDHYSFFLSSMLLTGVVNYIMILGHYYLVVPKLTEKPLIVGMKIVAIFISIKFILSLQNYFSHDDFFQEGSALGAGYMFNWILLSMRVLWGYVALGILAYFGYRLAKIRSIQSATGIYYVMVFFVFVGEIISAYLHYQYGLNI